MAGARAGAAEHGPEGAAPYGSADSDYRPDRWKGFREDYRFTGKEEDVEVGLTYFGARYLSTGLGRWVSADPLTVHGLGADLNAYAYVSGQILKNVDPVGLEKSQEAQSSFEPIESKADGRVANGNLQSAPPQMSTSAVALTLDGPIPAPRGDAGEPLEPKGDAIIGEISVRATAPQERPGLPEWSLSTDPGLQAGAFALTPAPFVVAGFASPLSMTLLIAGATLMAGSSPCSYDERGADRRAKEFELGAALFTAGVAGRAGRALPVLEDAAPAGAAGGAEETISVFHGSINNGEHILAHGLDPARAPTFVSRDLAAAQDALASHPDAVPGLGTIIESRIPASQFQSVLAPLERPYGGFFPYRLQSTEITHRTPQHIDLFNQFRVRP